MLGTNLTSTKIENLFFYCSELESTVFTESERNQLENQLATDLKITKELSGSTDFEIDKVEWLNRKFGSGATKRVFELIQSQ